MMLSALLLGVGLVPASTRASAQAPTGQQKADSAAPAAPAAQPAAGGEPTAAPAAAVLSPEEAAAYAQRTANLGLIVFPAKGQSKDQQALDQKECYTWSVVNTGVDPDKVSVNADSAAAVGEAKGDSAATGAGARGAARGAAGGAAVGAIAGDAGTGAAIGAVTGLAAGRRAKRQAQKQGEQQAVAQAESQAAGKIDTFKKGMSACLEGKGYTVK
jgi:hypothetical protein